MDDRATIVVGVDGSAGSRAALEYAMADAARRDAQVRVVSVFPLQEYWPAGYYGVGGYETAPETLAQLTTDIERSVQRMIQEAVAQQGVGAGVTVDVQALPGTPAKVLLEQARRADLLVLGHRGRGGFASALLGSVGLQCVLHAPCPVTIVRPAPQPVAGESPAVPAAAVPLPL
ncbi:universal stress protein [Pseudonocardia sp. H11422]|uniref:universal stress protein n=1 Tax=Pseudonocardia sp. H11422 TaxID=2835866 RepID=UPI001BDBF5DF|nr:universal stress protein [Pseudonocardia sp. H11422]